MAHPDQGPNAAPVAGIAEPHQSAVTAVLRAALQGVFSAAEAALLIARIRARAIPSPSPVDDVLPLSDSPNRTLS
jgi:hypothetical protein